MDDLAIHAADSIPLSSRTDDRDIHIEARVGNSQKVTQDDLRNAELPVFIGQLPEGMFEGDFAAAHGRDLRVFQQLSLRLPGSNLRFSVTIHLGRKNTERFRTSFVIATPC